VVLRSYANNKYVCAEGAGSLPLVANRIKASKWEIFELIANKQGYFMLKSLANNCFVNNVQSTKSKFQMEDNKYLIADGINENNS